jgi:AraC family transcriptional regulator, transcriptional activator of pobA
MAKQEIPIHTMDSDNIELFHVTTEMPGRDSKDGFMEAHRDGHYMFFLQESGESNVRVDFQQMQLTGAGLFYILPGQVHQYVFTRDVAGWVLAIDTGKIYPDYRGAFEEQLFAPQPAQLHDKEMFMFQSALGLLEDYQQRPASHLQQSLKQTMANTFIGLVADKYLAIQEEKWAPTSRPAIITRQFKALLANNFKTLKSPAQYAEALHYSLAHLNESVKNVTGYTVSHWIHHEIVLEAKRLLYYTTCTVKEIAAQLGYEDPAYFSRLFTNATNVSPGEFRKQIRE